MFEVTVNTRRAIVGTKELITTSSAGIQCQFTFSEDWDELSKIAIFRNGDEGQEIPVALPNSNLVEIPAQSCYEEYVDEPIFVGVYGTDGLGAVIIPTVWVSLGVLRPGAVTTGIITPAEPTPDMWGQILAIANNAAAIADECETQEEQREAAETVRDTAEGQRASNETSRQSAEETRAAAEENRGNAEQARVIAEQGRASAESARVEAEILRAQAETLRQQNETSRATAETERASAEQTRQSQESTRASNESARISAEQGRASAESSRVTAETNRVSAESSRASAETSRASAEQSRATAETARASAESSRVAAEQSRANAEADRVSAEAARVTEFAGLRTNFAPEYDSMATYAVGDLVLHEGVMYECNTAITTAEEWTAGHWTQTKVSDEVAELTRQLSDKQDAPSTAGTAGQVLALDDNLNPVWANQSGGGGGTTDYAQLSNKPTINNVELSGNKTLAELGINAGSVGFDETGTYADGSIGAGVSNQKNALNFTNQGALDYALNYDIDLFKFLKWTKGQYVDNSNGNIINNSRFYISDPIEVSDIKSDYLHLVITNSFTFKYAQYDANGDFLLGGSYGSAVDRVLSILDTCKTIRFSVGAWSGTYTLSDYLNAITIYVKPAHNVVIEDYIGYKELDFLYDKYIVTPSISTKNVSTTPVSFNQCVCLSTPCTKGQIFTITGTPRDNSGSRPVMFLDQANMCIYRSDEASAFNNVEITAPVTGTLVVNFLKAYPFQCYTGFKNLSEKIFKNLDSVNTIKSFPVDLIPDWLTNAMAIRTVGPLQKGYICLTCDDGASELESYTIPMLLNKQVPCTFGLWASTSKVGAAHPFNKSPVLQTPSGIAAVKNAIAAGCSVAQHGPHEWTDMTNEELNEFFDREAAAWEALEINVKGAICPSHCINNAVRVTAGGRFGVVRSGYRGYLSKADQQAVINGDVYAEYNYYCTGPRSNVFGLSSFNTNAVTLSWMKGAVDFAIAQKMILVAYWHDWDLTAEQKSDLEAFIDYAKAKNITFCTLGEIPFLA